MDDQDTLSDESMDSLSDEDVDAISDEDIPEDTHAQDKGNIADIMLIIQRKHGPSNQA